MLDPAHVLFGMVQNQTHVRIWLHNPSTFMEGDFLGMDEFMNVVLGDPIEIVKEKRRPLGKTLLHKGDSIVLVTSTNKATPAAPI